jgi:hypothetical protein
MVPCSGLPRALCGRLQAVVGGVAHHVGERVLDQVEHLAVELGVGAVHLEFDLLVQFAGEVAHDARQLLPGITDRLHARLHDAFLQFGGDVGEPLQRHLELGVLVAAGDFQELVAGQHQLGDHGHQVFERIDVDPDRLVGDLVGLLNLDLDDRFAGGRFVDRRLDHGLCLFGFGGGGLLGSWGRSGNRRRCWGGRGGLGRGLTEGPLQLIQRYFAGT